jgi:hypothetical protein
MKRSEILRFLILRTIGNFLVLFAVFGIIATFGPALYYEVSFKVAQARGVSYIVSSKFQAQSSKLIETQNVGIDDFAAVLAGPKVQ